MKLAKNPAEFSAEKCRLRVVEDADPYGCMIRERVRWERKKGPRKRSLKI